MPTILRFRSVWGVEPGVNFENWNQWFPKLKQHGYAGVEIDIDGLQDLPLLRRTCENYGLEISVLIFSSWPKCEGPKPAGLTPKDHLKHYRGQLEIAKTLNPFKVNSHSGDDQWSIGQAIEFFHGTLAIDAEVGLLGKVSHETHRSRCLFNPYSTAQVLAVVPRLQLTADFSHFVLVCERLLDQGQEDRELLQRIVPHVTHIHARIGTTQSSQCPDPTNAVFREERRFFETVWEQIIDSMVDSDQQSPITFVPEYGPYPYHPFGATMDFSDVADQEGRRLQPLFEMFARKNGPSGTLSSGGTVAVKLDGQD